MYCAEVEIVSGDGEMIHIVFSIQHQDIEFYIMVNELMGIYGAAIILALEPTKLPQVTPKVLTLGL